MSCTKPTDCTAVTGDYAGVQTETNGTWGPVITLKGTDGGAAYVYGGLKLYESRELRHHW